LTVKCGRGKMKIEGFWWGGFEFSGDGKMKINKKYRVALIIVFVIVGVIFFISILLLYENQ